MSIGTLVFNSVTACMLEDKYSRGSYAGDYAVYPLLKKATD